MLPGNPTVNDNQCNVALPVCTCSSNVAYCLLLAGVVACCCLGARISSALADDVVWLTRLSNVPVSCCFGKLLGWLIWLFAHLFGSLAPWCFPETIHDFVIGVLTVLINMIWVDKFCSHGSFCSLHFAVHMFWFMLYPCTTKHTLWVKMKFALLCCHWCCLSVLCGSDDGYRCVLLIHCIMPRFWLVTHNSQISHVRFTYMHHHSPYLINVRVNQV